MAQGVTDADERLAEEAAGSIEKPCASLAIARLGTGRTSPLIDRLHPVLGGPGVPDAMLVLCPKEVNFYGRGDDVRALDERFPGGWSGGALPERGYCGATRTRIPLWSRTS